MQRGYCPPSEQETLLMKRVADHVQAVRRSGMPRMTLFLNDREQALAQMQLNKMQHTAFVWQGGYPQAERKMLCVCEPGQATPEFPIACLRVQVQGGSAQSLTHRDYLGALMALRLKRECIGDILLDDAGAVLFVAQKFAALLCDEVREIGRCTVKTIGADAQNLSQIAPEPTAQRATVSSLRLDALLAAMMHISRSAAAQLIQAKAVMINHVETAAPHAAVYENDIFTVRGRGKYKLCEIGDKSKKDRIFVTFIQY